MLHYLRYLLVVEERDDDDLLTGRLLVGAGAPPAWFAPGQSFGATGLPTALGLLTLRCQTDAAKVVYELELQAAESPAAGPQRAATSIEVFYHDADGRHLSRLVQVRDRAQVTLER